LFDRVATSLLVALVGCAPPAPVPAPTLPTPGPEPAPAEPAPSPPSHVAVGPDEEAQQLLDTVVNGYPRRETYKRLLALLPDLSDAMRARVRTTGSDPDKPIRVIGISFEYDWIGAFVCVEPSNLQQAAVSGRGVSLDRLSFECNGEHHAIYFNYGNSAP
jgi:hypothetical protein